MNIKEQKKGISLIVLVITIIVMIILAAAIILSLDGSDIIGRAKSAKNASDVATAKEIVALAKSEWSYEKVEGYDTVIEYAEAKLEEAGYKTEGNGGIVLSESGAINTIYRDSNNKQTIIPEGFTVSSVDSEQTIATGLVIVDSKGNEFVWVPVDDITKFKLTSTYNGTITTPPWLSYHIEPINKTTWLITDISLYDEEMELYNSMKSSVEKNGGFYIARYEAGLPEGKTLATVKIDGTDKPVSKKGATVWNNIAWDATPNSTQYGYDSNPGAALVAKNAYGTSKSVRSHLTFGVEWDAALQFIGTEDIEYTEAGAGKGYYTRDEDGNYIEGMEIGPHASGYYAVNNIYDMAGNVWEWTYEIWIDEDFPDRVLRGGSYDESGEKGVHGITSSRSPMGQGYANYTVGFRIALYIK